MAFHFLLSAAARTLSLEAICKGGEDKAYQTFRWLRWPETDGEPVCSAYGVHVGFNGHDTLLDRGGPLLKLLAALEEAGDSKGIGLGHFAIIRDGIRLDLACFLAHLLHKASAPRSPSTRAPPWTL